MSVLSSILTFLCFIVFNFSTIGCQTDTQCRHGVAAENICCKKNGASQGRCCGWWRSCDTTTGCCEGETFCGGVCCEGPCCDGVCCAWNDSCLPDSFTGDNECCSPERVCPLAEGGNNCCQEGTECAYDQEKGGMVCCPASSVSNGQCLISKNMSLPAKPTEK